MDYREEEIRHVEQELRNLHARYNQLEDRMYRAKTTTDFLLYWRTCARCERQIAAAEEQRRELISEAQAEREAQQRAEEQRDREQQEEQQKETEEETVATIPDDVRRRKEELGQTYGEEVRIGAQEPTSHEELDLWEDYHAGQDERLQKLSDLRFNGTEEEYEAEKESQRQHPYLQHAQQRWEEEHPEEMAANEAREAQQRQLYEQWRSEVEDSQRQAEEQDALEALDEDLAGDTQAEGLDESEDESELPTPPAGTGNPGTSWYYNRESELYDQAADEAAYPDRDASERDAMREWSGYYGRCAEVREDLEAMHAEEQGITPNEAAQRDLDTALDAPEGQRGQVADELGLAYTEGDLEEMLDDSQEQHGEPDLSDDEDRVEDPEDEDDRGQERDDDGIGY